MNELMYKMIFKRKSFHLFMGKKNGDISESELKDISEVFSDFKPLNEDIKVSIKIVESSKVVCGRGGEYCILFYSEEKDNYLENVGYLGEQLDLYLASLNIGVLWFGIGKVKEETVDGLKYVIMFNISKVNESDFRKDMFKSKRKSIYEVWMGELIDNVSNIVLYAPSSCNTQPWIVKRDNKELEIYRYRKEGKRGIMPINKVKYYNRIDIGIFLLFLEICLNHENIKYERNVFMNDLDSDNEELLIAKYLL